MSSHWLSPIPVRHHRIYSNFLTFYVCSSLILMVRNLIPTILYCFMYVIYFSVYGTVFPTIATPLPVWTPSPPAWALTPTLHCHCSGLIDVPHSAGLRNQWATFLHTWPPYPAQTQTLCAGLLLSGLHEWRPHSGPGSGTCTADLLAPLRLQNHIGPGHQPPSLFLANALLINSGLQPTILILFPLSPLPSLSNPTWGFFLLVRLQHPTLGYFKFRHPWLLDWIVQEGIGRRKHTEALLYFIIIFELTFIAV